MQGPGVCAKLVQNMINDSCHHLFSELQHAEFKEAFNEFDKVRIYIFLLQFNSPNFSSFDYSQKY